MGWINDITRETDVDKVIQAIENILSELETYKKIAEKLAEHIDYYTYRGGGNSYDIDYGCDFQLQTKCVCEDKKDCKQCIIDWARKEVEK